MRRLPPGLLPLEVACAYAVVRAVRLLQEHGPLAGGDGLEVRGVHVHHCVHGLVLLSGRQLAHRRLSGRARDGLFAVGSALVLDELDVLLGCQDWAGAPRRRVLDGALLTVLLALAAVAAGRVSAPAPSGG